MWWDWAYVWTFLQSGTLWSYVAWVGIALLGLMALFALFVFWDAFKDFMESGGFLSLLFVILLAIVIPVTIVAVLVLGALLLAWLLFGDGGSSRRRGL